MTSSVAKICDQYSNPGSSQQKEKSSLKFNDFYVELDNILAQLPYVEALRFNLDCMERANALLQPRASNE